MAVITDQAIASSALDPQAAGRLVDGRYVLSSVLGRGGMAEVWEASDTVLGRRVAVKMFRGDPASDAEQQRQQAEIRLVAGLTHPNLVSVFDAGRDLGCAFLVMELVEGTTLARLLQLGALTPEEVACVGVQLASALAYVHARGVVHRDVKPANVLLGAESGQVTAKLTDFGIARIVDGTRLTLAGTTVGTANYLSPEQASGGDVTPASDVYSLGLLLLECLTGEVAFPGHGVAAAVARLHRDPAIPADLDLSWQGLLAAMTARDPATRPSAETVANRLRTLARSVGAPARLAAQVQAAAALGAGPARSPLIGAFGPGHPSFAGTAAAAAPRARRSRLIAAAAVVAASVAAVAVLLAVRGEATTARSAAAPRPYPSVSGTLGADLRRLEQAVPAGTVLRQDLWTLASLAASGRYVPARAWLAQLEQDAMYARASGALTGSQETRITGLLDAVRADLAARIGPAAGASPSSRAVRAATSSAAARPATSASPAGSPATQGPAWSTAAVRAAASHERPARKHAHKHRHTSKRRHGRRGPSSLG